MNLVLLGGADATHFPAGTPQAEHLLRVLKIAVGETFWCGVKNGVRGLATVLAISPDGAISFSVEWEKGVVFSPPPVRILVGLSRPQTMKKIFAAASEVTFLISASTEAMSSACLLLMALSSFKYALSLFILFDIAYPPAV